MNVIDDLKRDEGFRAKPYRDSEGLLTIGYGTLIEDGITEEEAGILLGHRANRIWSEGHDAFPWLRRVPEDAQRGLLNMAYNLGIPRLRGFRRMLAALEAGEYGQAADEALDSKWARQVGRRAERIAGLFRSCA